MAAGTKPAWNELKSITRQTVATKNMTHRLLGNQYTIPSPVDILMHARARRISVAVKKKW